MFSIDILFPLNEQNLIFFPKNINKELDVFNRYFFPLKWIKLIFLPKNINKELDVYNRHFFSFTHEKCPFYFP